MTQNVSVSRMKAAVRTYCGFAQRKRPWCMKHPQHILYWLVFLLDSSEYMNHVNTSEPACSNGCRTTNILRLNHLIYNVFRNSSNSCKLFRYFSKHSFWQRRLVFLCCFCAHAFRKYCGLQGLGGCICILTYPRGGRSVCVWLFV